MSQAPSKPSTTPEEGRGRDVRELFSSIANRYDLANHTLSGGLDYLWRRKAVQLVEHWNPKSVLDVATGSGDLALAIQKVLPEAKVIGTDFCEPMLEKAAKKGLRETVVADGLHMPFQNSQFDVLTISFGLRNMESWSGALFEFSRVLKPGGHLLILEFSKPVPIFRGLYRFYLHTILPKMAALLTGKRSAYEYLGASIEQFPSGVKMTELIESAGFCAVTAIPLSFGIVCIYTAEKKS